MEQYFATKGKHDEWDHEVGKTAAVESASGALDPPGKDMSPQETGCVHAQLDAYYQKAPNGPQMNDHSKLNPPKPAPGKVTEGYPAMESTLDALTGW